MVPKVDLFLEGYNSDIPEFALFWCPLHISIYRTRVIISHGLYVLNPLFEGQKRLSKGLFFSKILHCLWLVFKIGLWRHAYGRYNEWKKCLYICHLEKKILTYLKPKYFKKQRFSSSFLITWNIQVQTDHGIFSRLLPCLKVVRNWRKLKKSSPST